MGAFKETYIMELDWKSWESFKRNIADFLSRCIVTTTTSIDQSMSDIVHCVTQDSMKVPKGLLESIANGTVKNNV